MQDTVPVNNSVRFFPFWNQIDPNQVIGLLEMVNHIHTNNPNAKHWLELGSNIGESSTIFLGFPFVEKLECIEQAPGNVQLLKTKYSEYVQSNRCSIHHGFSYALVNKFDNESLDVDYIDADHNYDSVVRDIQDYLPKIRLGGFICGHDYDRIAWPGVVKAVDECAHRLNKQLAIFKDTSWLLNKD